MTAAVGGTDPDTFRDGHDPESHTAESHTAAGAAQGSGAHGSGASHGDGHEEAGEPLGPVDVVAWGYAMAGAAIGLVTAAALWVASAV